MKNNITLSEIAEKLKKAERVLILCHAHPDGDTLGSARGLKEALKGKDVRCICADPVPASLEFIFEGDELPADSAEGFYPDICVALDAATPALLGSVWNRYGDLIDIKIDHHGSGEDYAPFCCVDSGVSATGEMIYELAELMGGVDGACADALYTAIASDTGCFRYSNVTEKTFRIASALKEAGADTVRINEELFENRSKEDVSAMRAALELVKYHMDGKVISVTLDRGTKERYGIGDEHMHVVSALLKEIGGARLSVLIRETDKTEGFYKISMRSKAPVDCVKLCGLFGGGGHIRAAGGSVRAESAEEAERKVLCTILENVGEI